MEIRPSSATIYSPSDGSALVVSVECITPEVAEAYLNTSVGNRNLRESNIEMKLRPALREDRFYLNGEPIIFSEEGFLLDGHHRLYACTREKKSFDTVVIRGITLAAKRTMDTGAIRTIGDVNRMAGETNASLLGSIQRAYLVYQESHSFVTSTGSAVRDPDKLSLLLDESSTGDRLREAAAFVSAVCRQDKDAVPVQFTGGVYGLLYLLFKEKSEDIAVEFMRRVFRPEYYKLHSPETSLRFRLQSAVSKKSRIAEDDLACIFITGWNHRQARRPWKQAKVTDRKTPKIANANLRAYEDESV